MLLGYGVYAELQATDLSIAHLNFNLHQVASSRAADTLDQGLDPLDELVDEALHPQNQILLPCNFLSTSMQFLLELGILRFWNGLNDTFPQVLDFRSASIQIVHHSAVDTHGFI